MSHNNICCNHNIKYNTNKYNNIKYNIIYKLLSIFILSTIFLCIEVYGHIKTNSLSLLADALHMIMDVSGYIISLIVIYIIYNSNINNSNIFYTFGYYGYELVSSLCIIIIIWIINIYLIIESIHRYMHPIHINSNMMIVIAVIGIIINSIGIYIIHNKNILNTDNLNNTNILNNNTNILYKCTFDNRSFPSDIIKENINNIHNDTTLYNDNILYSNNIYNDKINSNITLNVTHLHLISDILQLVSTLVAATIMYFYPTLLVTDVLCTVIFSIIIFIKSINDVIHIIHILCNRIPYNININDIYKDIMNIDNIHTNIYNINNSNISNSNNSNISNKILFIYDIKVWSISYNYTAATISLLVDYIDIHEYNTLLRNINKYIKYKYNIDILNIEIHIKE